MASGITVCPGRCCWARGGCRASRSPGVGSNRRVSNHGLRPPIPDHRRAQGLGGAGRPEQQRAGVPVASGPTPPLGGVAAAHAAAMPRPCSGCPAHPARSRAPVPGLSWGGRAGASTGSDRERRLGNRVDNPRRDRAVMDRRGGYAADRQAPRRCWPAGWQGIATPPKPGLPRAAQRLARGCHGRDIGAPRRVPRGTRRARPGCPRAGEKSWRRGVAGPLWQACWQPRVATVGPMTPRGGR
jgi:hypothetical protein